MENPRGRFERISRKNIVILADGDCGSIIDSKWLSSSNQPSGFEAALSFTLPVTVSDESLTKREFSFRSSCMGICIHNNGKYILHTNYAFCIIHNNER